MVEWALHVGGLVGCGLVEELTLEVPLVLGSREAVAVQVVVAGVGAEGRRGVSVYSCV